MVTNGDITAAGWYKWQFSLDLTFLCVADMR